MGKRFLKTLSCSCFLGLLVNLLFFTNTLAADTLAKVVINYIEVNQAEDYSGNHVKTYLTATSEDNNPVTDIYKSDVTVLEDGREVDVSSVSSTSESISLVLALDRSGSMLTQESPGKTSMDLAKEAAIEFVNMLDDGDRIAIYSFNVDTNFHLDFTSDHDEAIRVINSLESKELAPTRLYDTVLEAVKKASEIPKGRRAVIVLTDGKDRRGDTTCSIHTCADVINAATTKTKRVPVYTIGVGGQVDAKELERIASSTGGLSMLAKNSSELPSFYRKLSEQLKNQLLIEYITRSPSGEHSLVVKVKKGNITEQDEKSFWSPPLPVMTPPEVTIIKTEKSEENEALINVSINITQPDTIKKVRYYVDSVLAGELEGPPFKGFVWDTSTLPEGLHVLRVEAVQNSGQASYGETTVRCGMVVAGSSQRESIPASQNYLYIILFATLLIFLLVVVLLLKRKSPAHQESPGTSGIQTAVKHAKGDTAPAECGDAPVDDEDDEVTTMDVKPLLEPLAKLTIMKSQKLDLGAIFKVTSTTTIGRGSENDIRIPDKPVSRKHAIINYAGNSFHIRDLNSSYGTKVDDKKVTGGGTALKDGAVIQLGTGTVMEFNVLLSTEEDKPGPEEDADKTILYD